MVRQKAIVRFNGHGKLKRDKLWDLKVHPGSWEFMSLLLQNLHVIEWSWMKDVVLHNVFRRLYLGTLFMDWRLCGTNQRA